MVAILDHFITVRPCQIILTVYPKKSYSHATYMITHGQSNRMSQSNNHWQRKVVKSGGANWLT